MAGYISTDSDGNLDDDDIDAILGLGTNNSQQQRLKLQMQLANALRTNSNDDPKGTMAGQVYIPPDPFAKGLSVYDHLKGIKDANSQNAKGSSLDLQRQIVMNLFAQKLKGLNQSGAPDPTQQPPPQVGDDGSGMGDVQP
jgi:hypothetical protein